MKRFYGELPHTHGERSTRFLCVDFRTIDEPRELERHDRICPRSRACQSLPERSVLRTSYGLPCQAQQTRDRWIKEARCHFRNGTKNLVIHREACHLDNILDQRTCSRARAVLDLEGLGKVLESRRARIIERLNLGTTKDAILIRDPEIADKVEYSTKRRQLGVKLTTSRYLV